VPTGTCPECDADVHVDTDADKGDVVSCEECGTDLEVVGLDPVELDIVEGYAMTMMKTNSEKQAVRQ
jgi:lysine biosynthesis protein LysW